MVSTIPIPQQSKHDQEADEIRSDSGDASGSDLTSLKQAESDQGDADARWADIELQSDSGLSYEHAEPDEGLEPRWKDPSSESQQVGLHFCPFLHHEQHPRCQGLSSSRPSFSGSCIDELVSLSSEYISTTEL